MKVVSIVGARPQFVKLAPLSRELRKHFCEIIIHTGQHYDQNMSDIFFRTLAIPKPHHNLNIGSGTHGLQTARMLEAIEKKLLAIKPQLVIVFGDTNSTLAGALAAAKLHIPIAHIEAGMRSFNRLMPEEHNRVVTDHLSDILFCSTKQSAQWLHEENITSNVHVVGDIMIDALNQTIRAVESNSHIHQTLQVKPKQYVLATIHRAENTDNSQHLSAIVHAFIHTSDRIIFPVHPRTKKTLMKNRLWKLLMNASQITLIEPLGYADMLMLEKHAKLIITDSGGIQKEAYHFKVPCLTVRTETEWVETVEEGWNKLVPPNHGKILTEIRSISPSNNHNEVYGSGKAHKNIATVINRFLNNN